VSDRRTAWAKAALVLILCCSPTMAVAALTAPATSTGTYAVSWTEPSGGQQRAYLFESVNLGPWIRNAVTGTISRTFTKPQGTYSYKLQLCFFEPEIGQELCDPFSPEVTVVVTAGQGVPGIPGNLGGDITNVTGTYTLSWAAASGTVTRYELEERVGTGLWNRIHNDSTSTITLTRADGHYDYRVRACNSVGCGGYTGITGVTVLRLPGVPGSLGPDITVPPLAYVISWGPSSGTVARYELHESTNNGAWAIVHDSPARSRTFSNKPMAVYDYRVRACNNSGCSAFTATKRVTVAPEDNIDGPTASIGCYTLQWGDTAGDQAQLQERRPGGPWTTVLRSRIRTSVNLCTCLSGTYQYRLRFCIPPEPGFPGFCPPWGQVHSVAVNFTGHLRRNVSSLDPSGPEIAALRRGIEVMQSRPVTDPTSWLYQANIHGTFDRPLQPAWNSCQHGSWFFLPWHRMYLYYFERILRAASGDANLALPYWNYSNASDPDARRLPLPFRQPANASNPLFLSAPNRSAAMNAGGTLPESAVALSDAFDLTNFSSPAGRNQSFGGQELPAPVHYADPHSVFENTPHDTVHGSMGGFMGGFNFAARDPIFWLHHANIDRLWKRWRDQGGGRTDPH
jgi:Common central domain of tyrosinase